MEGIYINSDILFHFYGISDDKLRLWKSEHDTGDKNLNFSLKLLDLIEQKKWKIIISDISITELLGVLNRLKSKKIIKIMDIIFKDLEIITLNDIIPKLAWILSAHYGFHTGDSLHLSLVLFYQIKKIAINDDDFIKRIKTLKNEIKGLQGNYNSLFSIFPNFTQNYNPKIITNALNHLKNLEIITKEEI